MHVYIIFICCGPHSLTSSWYSLTLVLPRISPPLGWTLQLDLRGFIARCHPPTTCGRAWQALRTRRPLTSRILTRSYTNENRRSVPTDADVPEYMMHMYRNIQN